MARRPLILIGGTLCDARLWQPLLDGWSDTDVITVTVGERTDKVTMQGYAAELLGQMPASFALAGFSLGGLVALEMAAQAPERIGALALISAGAGPEPDQGAEMRRAGEAAVRRHGMAAHVCRDLVPRYAIQEGQVGTVETLIAMAEAVGPDLYRRQNDLAISRVDTQPRLSRIRCPVLLATGSNDPLCPPSRHEEIAPSFNDAARAAIPGCGHLVPLEAVDTLRTLLRNLVATSTG